MTCFFMLSHGFAAVPPIWMISLRSDVCTVGISVSIFKIGLACQMLGNSIEPFICCSKVSIFLGFPAHFTDFKCLIN